MFHRARRQRAVWKGLEGRPQLINMPYITAVEASGRGHTSLSDQRSKLTRRNSNGGRGLGRWVGRHFEREDKEFLNFTNERRLDETQRTGAETDITGEEISTFKLPPDKPIPRFRRGGNVSEFGAWRWPANGQSCRTSN